MEGDFYNRRLNIHDYPLSQKGIRECTRLVDFFAGRPIDCVFARLITFNSRPAV